MALSGQLTASIASAQTDPYFWLFDGFPIHPDEIYSQRMGDLLYDTITQDGHAAAALETRVRNVVCREYIVKPASSSKADKRIADLTQDVLTGFDFDLFCADLMFNSYLKGNGFNEFSWDIDAKTTFIRKSGIKPNHRFRYRIPEDGKYRKDVGYFDEYEIRVLDKDNYPTGETIPARRILSYRYTKVNNGNPYGIGLGRGLYWLALIFKKEAIKQRVIYLDKYAQPTIVGKAKSSATQDQRQDFLNTLRELVKGGYIVLPEGWEIMLLEAQRQSTNDVFQNFLDWCDNEMSKLVIGETLSIQLPKGSGSRAATQTHQEGSAVYLAKYDADRFSTGPLRELCRWIQEVNDPDAKPAMVWRRFPELDPETEDLNSRAQRDNTLNSIGYKITPKKVEEVYGDGYEDTSQSKNPPPQQGGDTGGFNLGFSEYEARKVAAFKKRLSKINPNVMVNLPGSRS